MSVELQTDDGAARLLDALAPVAGSPVTGSPVTGSPVAGSMVVEAPVADDDPSDRRRPNVSGDLPALLDSAPMFRRALVGYDRFQVDTYVRWAEDELTTADRERRHLEARHSATRAALEEAELLLSHSSSGGEFLQISRRIGALLATAADEAESMRAAAEAERAAAAVQAQRLAEHAERLLAAADAQAGRTVLAASAEAGHMAARARRTVGQAERTLTAAAAEVVARLERLRAMEQRAADAATDLGRQAEAEVRAARLRARAEIVAMLDAGRDERRRADAEALATRERLDREADDRRSFLLGEVTRLDHLRAALQAEVEHLAAAAAEQRRRRSDLRPRLLPQPLRWRSRSLRAP